VSAIGRSGRVTADAEVSAPEVIRCEAPTL
jgi:hypothetical protein